MIRKIYRSIPFGLILLVIILGVQLGTQDYNKEWQQSVDLKLDNFIAKQDSLQYRDSCYFEHVKECSWIDKESVRVGRNGVLYSNYHKRDGRY